MTNPVASLAALLRTHPMFVAIYDDTASPTQQEMDERFTKQLQQRADELAEWLLARGVQYAPREHRAGCAADVWVEDHYEPSGEACDCEAAPPREPPPDDDEIAAWRTLELTRQRRLTGQPLIWLKWHVMEEVEREEWRGRFLGARGRPEGPSAPPGPWVVEEGLTEGEFRVGLPANEVAYERVYDFRTGAEARAVCDALNRVGSRPPEGT